MNLPSSTHLSCEVVRDIISLGEYLSVPEANTSRSMSSFDAKFKLQR